MYETHRMLGREHEADLEREAATRALAAEARGHSRRMQPESGSHRARTCSFIVKTYKVRHSFAKRLAHVALPFWF